MKATALVSLLSGIHTSENTVNVVTFASLGVLKWIFTNEINLMSSLKLVCVRALKNNIVKCLLRCRQSKLPVTVSYAPISCTCLGSLGGAARKGLRLIYTSDAGLAFFTAISMEKNPIF
jgi:hypothetical protein